MDLNFVELDRNAYDLIISVSTIHHVVNLEWLRRNLGSPGLRVVDATVHLPDLGRNARAEYLAEHIPGARLVTDPGCGHTVRTSMDGYDETVEAFLAEGDA